MKNVLIIEDDESLIEGLTLILKEEGYAAKTVPDHKKITPERVRQLKPDIILLDYLLPKENGLIIASRLQQHTDTKQIPIIMMSATKSIMEKAIQESGVKYFLAKPFDIDHLLSVVAKYSIHT